MNEVTKTHPMESIWTEAYRPITIDACVLPKNIKDIFKGYVERKDTPHLLLSGGAGQGKTTIAKALCNELGFDFILLNLSNDRGIDVLRTTMTQYASSVSLSGNTKVIICDEFDSSTPILQSAFRAFMEEYSQHVRFFLTCNFPNRIIQPIHSRCSVIDFHINNEDKPALAKQMFDRAGAILTNEGIGFDKRALVEVITKHFPDYRRTLNELQRYASATGKIDGDVVKYGSNNSIDAFTAALKAKSFKDARKWIAENIGTMSTDAVFRAMYDSMYDLVEPQSIPQIVLIIAEYQYKSVTCPDQELNMAAFSIEVMSGVEFK
jgi:replication factor C small subunit